MTNDKRVAVGWVAADQTGQLFSAWVDFAGEGPFGFMQGPDGVSAGEAVGWARRRAPLVEVRLGNTHFSAGEDQKPGLPLWTGEVSDLAADDVPESAPSVPWRVEARCEWLRDDGCTVAARLADALGCTPRASSVTHDQTETGFRVVLTLSAAGLIEAREQASRVLRTAWRASGIHAEPGTDFDVVSVDVRLAHPEERGPSG